MRVNTFFRTLRIIAAVTLFFFAWSFLPLYSLVAYAAEGQKSGDRQGQVASSKGQGRQGPGAGVQGSGGSADRFEKALDAIRENVSRAGEKAAKGEDDTWERNVIKAKRAEIESADGEFKKEFSATEKKLKDAKLPKEILDRHYKFVKHYEYNLKELRVNLAAVEQYPADSKQGKEALKKAKAHLEKVKAPSKHQKLDPNNLPFRARKAGKTREPRLKKEEFERDFPSKKKTKTAFDPKDLLAADSRRSTQILDSGFKSALYRKPILVASNGSLAGLLSSDNQLPRTAGNKLPLPSVGEGWPVPSEVMPHSGGEGASPKLAFSDTSPFLLAQVTVQPSAEDLAETPDVQFTDDIRAKAQELGGKPLKIYEWVRNNIEYAPTYGSIQGADQCLQSKICNDMDTASLLIALLRVSGVYSHYEYSTIEIPIEQAMNWVGGVTDPKMVGTILATNGIPAKMLVSGGTYKAVQLEHVYVSAFIDYIPSRGAVHKQGDTWIPLDPSFKQYEFKRGMDLYAAMGISGEKYLMDYITDTSSLTIPTELQASFPAYTISPYQYYSKRLFNYVDTNLPAATYQDIFGADTIEASRTIIQKEYPYLLGTLPYKVIATGTIYTSLPDNLRLKVTFTIENADSLDAGLTYTTTQPEIAGKRVTLSYVPATTADEALVSRYGTLLSVPPYLLNVKVVLKINGVTLATGNTVGLGQEQTFNMIFTIPNLGTEFVTNKVTTGDYSAIAILSQKVPVTQAGDKMETLINNIGSSDLDDLLGQMLYNVGILYFHRLNFEEELYAKNFQMIVVKGLSEAMITSHAVTNSLFGVPYNISEGAIGIDVDKNEYLPFSYDGNKDRARDFMIVSGFGSSAWEDRMLQAFYDVPSVSAARLLRYASQQGVPIYTIDGGNINTIVSQLQVASDVIDDIRNAVNAGKKVIISKTSVQYEALDSIGYIVLDPTTGAAGFMISGGMAGGMTGKQPAFSVSKITQYLYDGSALRTIVSRAIIVSLALAQLGTPYVEGGADDSGFDCSGLVYYLYASVYGKKIFPYKCGETKCGTGCASCQYEYIEGRKWTRPYDARLDGDILWSDGYSHTGIYYGIPFSGVPGGTVVDDAVIHANRGKWFSAVIITSTNNDAFTGGSSGGIMSEVGRPLP